MASFLAGLKAATAKIQPAHQDIPQPAGVDARALQTKLAAALGAQSPDPDADLLSLHARYREARKEMLKVLAERVSSEDEAELIMRRRDSILRDLAKLRAKTLRGFAAKMEALRTCECRALEKTCPQEPDALLLQSIVADSYWLFETEAAKP